MLNFFLDLPVVIQTLIATLFCWFCTTLGASIVFFFVKIKPKYLTAMLALASGVMIASSFFSLLQPAIEACKENNLPTSLYVAIGFIIGGLFIVLSDKILDKFFKLEKYKDHKAFKKSIIFTGSITIHNIPEGMAVGVAFGSIGVGLESATVATALLLALGIGIQNIPEGTAVSIPLKQQGCSSKKSFIIATLSGIVEPLFAPLACLLCIFFNGILPFLLSFAAGTMIAVATCELMPEACKGSKNYSILFVILGFAIMAVLDTSF